MSQPGIVAMPPCLVTEHLQLAAMTVASCRCLPIVAQLKAPIDSQEAAPLAIQSKNVTKRIFKNKVKISAAKIKIKVLNILILTH